MEIGEFAIHLDALVFMETARKNCINNWAWALVLLTAYR